MQISDQLSDTVLIIHIRKFNQIKHAKRNIHLHMNLFIKFRQPPQSVWIHN